MIATMYSYTLNTVAKEVRQPFFIVSIIDDDTKEMLVESIDIEGLSYRLQAYINRLHL